MSPTMHERSAIAMLDQILEDPDGAETLALANAGLREERWGADYIDAIGQHGLVHASRWPMEQVAAFARVHAMIYSGDVAMVMVGTRGEAGADSDREANAAALSRLPGPFSATVSRHQRNAGYDGVVRWDQPIWVELLTGLIERRADGSTSPYPLRFMIPPGNAPLEIGSSLPSKTWAHLVVDHGAVARWPYGYSAFRMFVNLRFIADKEAMIRDAVASGRKRQFRLALANPVQGELF